MSFFFFLHLFLVTVSQAIPPTSQITGENIMFLPGWLIVRISFNFYEALSIGVKVSLNPIAFKIDAKVSIVGFPFSPRAL